MEKSKLFNLNWNDFTKGLIMAVIGSVVGGLLGLLDSIVKTGVVPAGKEWMLMGIGALISGLSYISRNLLRNSEGQLLKKEGE